MKILFAGTSEIAVPSVKALSDTIGLDGVLTSPDAPSGRGKKVVSSPVCRAAEYLHLQIFTPNKLDASFIEEIRDLHFDILVVFAYGKIFKKEFLDIFPLGAINLHPSLLPRYRGPSPIPEAILNGDDSIGITVQKLALKVDSGGIILQRIYPLNGTETTESLTAFCAAEGFQLLREALAVIAEGNVDIREQIEEEATYCRLVKKEDGAINWSDQAITIERKIRAYTPWPGTFTMIEDRRLTIRAATVHDKLEENSNLPGTVLGLDKTHGILVQTGKGILGIKRLQWQNKREANHLDFWNGSKKMAGQMMT